MVSPKTTLTPDPSQEVVQELIDLYNQDHFEAVLLKVEPLIGLFPKSVVLFNIQGVCNASLKRDSAAIKSYEQAIRINPDYAEAYNNMGFALNNRGDLEAAIDSHKQAIKIKPDYAEAYLNLGVALYNKGDLGAAIESYKKATSIKPDYFEAHFNLGFALSNKGDLDAAIDSYKKAINLKSDHAEAYYELGRTLGDRGYTEAAIGSYKKAVLIQPDYAEAFFKMGLAFINKGDLEGAIHSYHQATRIEPNHAEAHYYLGNALGIKYNRSTVLNNEENLQAAIDSYKQALKIKPDHFEAFEGMSFWLRHYIWALNNQLTGKLEKNDHLIELEKRKLKDKIKECSFWFVDITRTSSTAIKVALGAKFGWPFGQNYYLDVTGRIIVSMLRSLLLPSHTPAFIVKHILGDELWKEIDTFTVVRNPYSWCSSLWHHAMKNHDLGLKTESFDLFLGSLEEKLVGDFTKRKIFPSNYRQSDYLLDADRNVIVKNLLRFEDKKIIDNFLKSRGIIDYSTSPRFVATQSSDYQIASAEKTKIERIFSADFEILGY